MDPNVERRVSDKSVMQRTGSGEAEETASSSIDLASLNAVYTLEEREGQRLARAMRAEGLKALDQWRHAWEPQIHGGACAAASAMSALRFLGLDEGWSQQRIFDRVLRPHSLITAGVSFENGAKMLRLISRALEVTTVSTRDNTALQRELRADLEDAFFNGAQICILVNFLRPSGGGHWSPLGGFSENRALILDTNSQKHPPHWMHVGALVHAMTTHNNVTGRPRGYILLRKS